MSEVNEYLDSLQADGSLESEGTFSLDLDKAREKLEQFRLTSPDHYILSLLTAAVCCGSESFTADLSEERHTFVFGGTPFRGLELKGLFESLLMGRVGAETRLTELGVAVQGARGLALRDLFMTSGNSREAISLTLEQSVVSIEAIPEGKAGGPPTLDSTQVVLSFSGSKVKQMAAVILGLRVETQAAKILKQYGRYAPIDVVLNGEKLNTKRLGPWVLAAKVGGYEKMLELHLSSERQFQLQGNGKFGGYVGLADGPGAWMIVNNGVAFQLSPTQSAYPTSRAVIYTEHLLKDLSGGGLVRNSDFEELSKEVDRHITKMARQAGSGPKNPKIQGFLARVRQQKKTAS